MIFVVRFGVLAAVLTLSSSARAGWLETGGFVGVDALPSDVKLGNSADPEQRPQTGPEFGARVGWMAMPMRHFELGVEAEVALTASWTGYGFATGRASDFAPVIGYRGSLVLRFSDNAQIKPHVLAGVGGATVITGSPYLHDTSDPQLYYGIGATIDLGHDLQLRVDARQGWLPTETGEGATYELLVGIGTTYGRPPPPPVEAPLEPLPSTLADKPLPTGDDRDLDPPTPPTPPPTPPTDPNADSDHDGVPDSKDACPHDAETVNGYEDDDGCPDSVPAAITTALDAARAARFEPKHVRLTDAAATAFDPALEVLRTHPRLHVDIIAHADADDAGSELATKRADAVKWHFIEQGVPADQLAIVVGAPQSGANAAPIELALHVPSAPQK
jgi:outer membrane protein OmpA-like peptidoglycan-associated protein